MLDLKDTIDCIDRTANQKAEVDSESSISQGVVLSLNNECHMNVVTSQLSVLIQNHLY